MKKPSVMTVMGLMSGTSLDGVDVAILETDGLSHAKLLNFTTFPYASEVVAAIKSCFGAKTKSPQTDKADQLVVDAHLKAIKFSGVDLKTIDLIGFHGQTITHDPLNKFTWQIGDAQKLADSTGVNVVGDFRLNDVASGGQGAPLLPVYHEVLVRKAQLDLPVVVVNIGGVSNLTWVGPNDNDLIAFDTGTGNALLDDWVRAKTGRAFDDGGALSVCGTIDEAVLARWMSHDFFKKIGTKSLDRNAWSFADIAHLGISDGAATLAAFTAHAIAKGIAQTPKAPHCIIVCGGGRKNMAMMRQLELLAPCPVMPCDHFGWNGDAVEAEGFAYMAVRSFLGLPISFPKTTGVSKPLSGGQTYKPRTAKSNVV